jgi:hypothetical protein
VLVLRFPAGVRHWLSCQECFIGQELPLWLWCHARDQDLLGGIVLKLGLMREWVSVATSCCNSNCLRCPYLGAQAT